MPGLLFLFPKFVLLQNDFALGHHFANVDKRVTQRPQSGIDTNPSQRRDFFKTHVGVVTQDYHLTLFGRQCVHQMTDTVVGFATHNLRIGAIVTQAQHLENVEIFRRVDMRAAFVPAVIVHAHVVGDTHGPLHELAFVIVLAPAERVDDFDENLLKRYPRQVPGLSRKGK